MNHIQEYLLDPGCNPPVEVDRYLNGDCHLFAIAVHRLTGWNIVAITEPRFVLPEGVDPKVAYQESLLLPENEKLPYAIRPGLVHAFCYSPIDPTKIFDAKGWRSLSLAISEYETHNKCVSAHYSQTELYNIVHHDKAIDEIKMAEAMIFARQYYVPLFKKL